MKKIKYVIHSKVQAETTLSDASEISKWKSHLVQKSLIDPGGDWIEEDIVESVEEKRKKEYQKEIDPFFQEAVLEHLQGKPEKMNKILEEYEKIKTKYPKASS